MYTGTKTQWKAKSIQSAVYALGKVIKVITVCHSMYIMSPFLSISFMFNCSEEVVRSAHIR